MNLRGNARDLLKQRTASCSLQHCTSGKTCASWCRRRDAHWKCRRTAMASVGQIAHLLVLVGSTIMGSGLVGLGAMCCAAPATAAELYGLPVQLDEAVAWVRVAGLRDAGLGVATFALLAYQRPALRYFVPAILLIPLGDAVITWSAPGGTATGAATHLAGTVAIGILSVCAWLDPTLSSTALHEKSKR